MAAGDLLLSLSSLFARCYASVWIIQVIPFDLGERFGTFLRQRAALMSVIRPAGEAAVEKLSKFPQFAAVGFLINEEALAELEAISGPLAVVAAMGPIHSGKSFFLNSLLGREGLGSSGFPVGFTVAPGSRGLSLYSKPLLVDRATGALLSEATASGKAAEADAVRVLMLDSEGFGGPNVTRSYDQLLYAIGSLLASHVIFVSMKMIDAQDLEGLTAQQWFEGLLQTNRWHTPPKAIEAGEAQSHNKHSLRTLYPSVECFALKAPTSSGHLLQRLDRLMPEDEDPDYRTAFDAVRRRDLAELVRFLVAAANANMFEDVQVFMNHFSTVRSAMAKNDLLLLFSRDLHHLTDRVLPLLPEEVAAAAAVLRSKTLALWQQQTAAEAFANRLETNKQEEQLIKKMDETVEKALQTASKLVAAFCQSVCEAQLSVQREAAELQMRRLPMPPKELADFSSYQQQQSKSALLQRLRPGGRDYSALPSCTEQLNQHFESVQALYLELHSANIRSITDQMQRAADRAAEFVRQQLQQQPLDFIRPLQEFKGLLLDWQQAAWTLFESDVASLRDVADLHSDVSADLARRLGQVEAQGLKTWSAKCMEASKEVLSRWELLFHPEVMSEFSAPLPIEEDALEMHIQQVKARARQELARLYCASSEPWKEVSAELEHRLHEMGSSLEEANLEAIKTNCSKPLDRLKEELADEAGKYYFWHSFALLARQRAEDLLLSESAAIKTNVRLSPSLVSRVSVHWIQTELRAAYEPQLHRNFMNLLSTVIGVLMVLLGICLALSFSSLFFGVSVCGLILAVGLQTVVSVLRAGFEHLVLGLLGYLYARLGLEVSFTVVVVCISAMSLFLYSKYYLSLTKPTAGAQASTLPNPMLNRSLNPSLHPHVNLSSAFSSPTEAPWGTCRPRPSLYPRSSTFKDEP
ncbi:guanylate binding domain-containing protein [Cyclospora cayetanensis]|uniref:Guanylate binding domain-containing protein n=1 Tax=Cyclospora cayetanensis TaxID=88456 RepID=A0A1D3D324_9EIME|nr:guanylate binding domain-containing protein [Cyclospora cayetanensis]